MLGLVTGLALVHTVPDELRLMVGTGFLGGSTTYSIASVETVRLAQQGRLGAAPLNGLGSLLIAVAAGAVVVGGAVRLDGSHPWSDLVDHKPILGHQRQGQVGRISTRARTSGVRRSRWTGEPRGQQAFSLASGNHPEV